ncbi:MAG TPA: PPK2 family polyphosphate kinase [Candidatus Dormibacteraeota bacterium]
MNLRERLLAHVALGHFSLAGVDPDGRLGVNRGQAERGLAKGAKRLAELQDRLHAEGRRSLLVVLQGMDTSGKDGTVKHVMAQMNPQGVGVVGFREPTPEEARRGFLWRIRRALPQPGEIVIFNRSHYEDVLVPRVKKTLDEGALERRYGQINRFEKELVEKRAMTVIKICLHISYEEQRERLIARLRDPGKRWKFSENDLVERGRWDEYMAAYDLAIARCATPWAPWYVVPANRKWFRNWAVAQILTGTLEEMNPAYPQPKLDVEGLEARLRGS